MRFHPQAPGSDSFDNARHETENNSRRNTARDNCVRSGQSAEITRCRSPNRKSSNAERSCFECEGLRRKRHRCASQRRRFSMPGKQPVPYPHSAGRVHRLHDSHRDARYGRTGVLALGLRGIGKRRYPRAVRIRRAGNRHYDERARSIPARLQPAARESPRPWVSG